MKFRPGDSSEPDFQRDYWRSAPTVPDQLPVLSAEAIGDDQFRMLADNLPTLCWIANGDGYIVWYNRRWHEYCGTTPEQMEGWGWQSVHDPELLPEVMERWTESVATGEPFEMTFPLKGADGVFRPFLTRIQPVRDRSGKVARWFGVNADISGQAAAEAALREANVRQEEQAAEQAAILAQLAEGVIVADAEGRIVFVNEAAERLHGTKSLDVGPDDYSETYRLFTEDGRPYPPKELPLARAVLNGETVLDARWRIRRPDGTEILAIGSARPLDIAGQRAGGILTLRDDTERHQAEQALRESEERLRLVVDGATDYAILTTDTERRITSWSQGAANIFGYPAEEAVGRLADDLFTPEDRATGRPEHEAESARESGCANDERWHLRADGGRVFLNGSVHPLPADEDGRERGFIKIARDETDRRASEAALRETEERYRLAVRATNDAIWDWDLVNNNVLWNEALYSGYGYAPEEVAPTGEWWIEQIHPEDRERVSDSIHAVIDGGSERWKGEYRFRTADGDYRSVLDRGSVIRDADGNAVRMIGAMLDLTERRRAEAALRELNETLEARVEERTRERDRVWNVSQDLFVICGFDGYYRMANPAWSTQLGHAQEDLVGTKFDALVHPDDAAATHGQFERLVSGSVVDNFDIRIRAKDGSYHWYSWTCVPEGDVFYAAGRDVTLRKELEEQLRQSQKMETVGQLTGGIAHDFNNLLQIISGNLDILSRKMPEESAQLRRYADRAIIGAGKAATLTQRLLAFSRRQPLSPKPTDINKLVSSMSELLYRTLGEAVEVETVLAPRVWLVETDPNQLENAILNLALNARDAMPDGGKLTIETQNTHLDNAYISQNPGLSAGQYVVICISDTGAGMDAATVAKAIEPFFTTKEVGKGTGLGLSMVYGFIKQSDGHLKIYSEPDEGTTVKIYLPRRSGNVASDAQEVSVPLAEGSGEETILVCEDDENVRAYSAEVLRELGYRVLEAEDGPSALRLLSEQQGQVDLLFTDVVLPGGMSGAVLAKEATALQPGLKTLFTTGYARNAIVHHGRLDPGVQLITKPFSSADLAARIRDILDVQQ